MGRGLTRSWWKPAFVEFGKNPHAYLLAAQKEYGNTFWLDLLLLKPVFALSPGSTVPFYAAPERDLSFVMAAIEMSQQISSREQWIRQALTHNILPGISSRKRLEMYGPKMVRWNRICFSRWVGESKPARHRADHEKVALNLFECAGELMTSFNLACFVGEEFAREHAKATSALVQRFDKDLTSPILRILPTWVPHPVYRRLASTRSEWRSLIAAEISSRKSSPSTSSTREDYLQYLIEEDEFRNEEEYPTGILTVLFGALTNMKMTFAWSVVHILRDDGLRRMLVREIDESGITFGFDEGGAEDEEVLRENAENVARLPVLDSLIKEVMRFYASLFRIRKTMKPYEVDGHTIPPNTSIFISPWLINHSPDTFDDADTFQASRFLAKDGSPSSGYDYDGDGEEKEGEVMEGGISRADGRGEVKKSGDSRVGYKPWGSGAHRCPGEKYALQGLKLALFVLLQEYDPRMVGDGKDVMDAVPDWSKMGGAPPAKGVVRWSIKRRTV